EIWFSANVPEGQDHNDIAPSGYTWLEEYLNGVDRTKSNVKLGKVKISPNSSQIQLNDTLQLSTTFMPSNATNKTGKWTSSDEKIANVNANGLVKGVAKGEATITFISNESSIKATSLIKVLPEGVTADAGANQTICAGTTATLTATGGATYLWSTGAKTAS